MCRYPPSTIHRYLDLPSTQRIQNHTYITPPPPAHDPGPSPLPTPHLHHRNQHTDTCPTPSVPTGLVKPKPNSLIHSPPLHPHRPEPKHIHISHTPPTPLTTTHLKHVTCTRQKHLNHVYRLIHALTANTPPPDPHTALPSPSQQTRMQHKQQYMHHSHRNNRQVANDVMPQVGLIWDLNWVITGQND